MVGEGTFGAFPSHSFLVENLRERPVPTLSTLISGGGVVRGCSGFGSGCDLSLAMRTIGSVSSRNFLLSSTTLLRYSFMTLSSDSAAMIRWSLKRMDSMTLAMSSCVAAMSIAFPSAAGLAVSARVHYLLCSARLRTYTKERNGLGRAVCFV